MRDALCCCICGLTPGFKHLQAGVVQRNHQQTRKKMRLGTNESAHISIAMLCCRCTQSCT